MELFGKKFNLIYIFLFALLLFIAMATPSVRRVIWWILPLGSGWDDILGALALAIIFGVLFIKFWTRMAPKGSLNKKKKEEKNW